MNFITAKDSFELTRDDIILLRHVPGEPCLFAGRGTANFAMYRGNFDIDDYITERIPLRVARVNQTAEGAVIVLAESEDAPARITLDITMTDNHARIGFTAHDPSLNRFWLRLPARTGEHVWGGGEQMSYFDLRGRRFPLWTSEPGVGRDKTSELTFKADKEGHAGGDYWNTNYPQPSFLSSDRYAAHVETTAYTAFDFRHDDFHELEFWACPEAVEFLTARNFVDLVKMLANRFGKPPALPDWVHDGAILGLKDGPQSFTRMTAIIKAGAKVTGLWCEDWCGIRQTSFGRRLFWDWRWSRDRYPDLPARIEALRAYGIRFLGYVNPYLAADGALFPEAESAGYLACNHEGGVYLVDFGEFDCGIVDFTNQDACAWFSKRIIGQEMIGLGLSGWMADFGEYLPVDAKLANGQDATLAHNAWPVLWAKVNADAVAAADRTDDILFFMRAGFSGVQHHNRLLWAGDQSVDFSRHDGIGTVICAALSSGLLGNPYHHSDIGGYTSLFGNLRTPELLMRWTEMAVFTPVMRSHEGNRPDDNLQLDQNPKVLAHFARMTRIFAHLAPYRRAVAAEAAATGLPMQRPLFLHFEHDLATYALQESYLLGADLLVAPVIHSGVEQMRVYLPSGAGWRHLWSDESFTGGHEAEIAAPFGQPPVFYREGSKFTMLFTNCRFY